MGREPATLEIGRRADSIARHEKSVALAGRSPLGAKADDRGAGEPSLEEIRQIKVREIDIPADERVLELAARRIRHLDDCKIDAVRSQQTLTQRVIGPEHREPIAVMRELKPHRSNLSLPRARRSHEQY